MRHRLLAVSLLLTLGSALPLLARIISYSPYTDSAAFPAHQLRTNRHFVLVEGDSPFQPWFGPVPSPSAAAQQVVVYDFLGVKEPQVVYPREGTARFAGAAVRENGAGVPSILLLTHGEPDDPALRYRLSTDGGLTWKTLDIAISSAPQQMPTGIDIGGRYAAARGSQLRIGTEQVPFVVSSRTAIHAIAADGTHKTYLRNDSAEVVLIGGNAAGTQFLVVSAGDLYALDIVRDAITKVGAVLTLQIADGWITPTGAVYLEERTSGIIRISRLENGTRTVLREAPANALNLFAVPTHDDSGAWIIDRGAGKPTTLYLHTSSAGMVEQWQDITAPEVEALHPGSSGTKVLIQVHRPRPQADQRIFQDPALAVWTVGDPAPRFYDELYMDEQFNKGFVHLDVEKIESGEPFVFDSGVRFAGGWGGVSPSTPPPPTSGGGDVIQEWGVVRASLKQRLVLPAVGRTHGAYGSNWATDVIIHNPSSASQNVEIRFAASGASTVVAQPPTRTVTLQPHEIRLIPDVLKALFNIEAGTGAFFVEPASGVTMTSRTYSQAAAGTYGFGMSAVDVYASAASARFPLTFAGAFLGNNYRTNLVITDAGDHGSRAAMRAAGSSGLMGLSDVTFDVSARGQQQVNSIGPSIGLFPFETGALLFRPTRGLAIASIFAIDNRTNDSTFFPPDLPAPVVRTIPAIGHVDGANNARFRSDLYLYNPASQVRTVSLQMQKWDSRENAVIQFTMLPNEARVIRDVLPTLFGTTGIARLRYQSSMDSTGIRVTSRTYSEREDGGTYGFLMPPLNNFQSGGFGDTLEILGAVAHADYRTNIGLVDLAGFAGGQPVNVRIDIVNAAGVVADSFTVNVPSAGGMQLNDVFRARSLDISGPVLIRVSPLNGLVGAYATHIDNRTNDASYLAANLAAKQ